MREGAPELGPLPSRCHAEIDLVALRGNAQRCGQLAGPQCRLMAVVKADAYGHGLEQVAAALADSVSWFGVANLGEARRVRAAVGADARVLLLGPVAPEEVEFAVAEGVSASVSRPDEVEAFAAAAARAGLPARLHVVVDTGMGRMGCRPEDFLGLVERIRRLGRCRLEGMASHFPSADEDPSFTRSQIRIFAELVSRARPEADCEVHLANSAGLLGFQEEMPFATLARPGLALYGVSPLADRGGELRPVLRLATRVTLVREIPEGSGISYGRTFVADREMRVATLAAGYGDGYPRHLSGRGACVLVSGRRCPVLGRVTMDQIVVDVSALEEVRAGDEAILIGRQGDEEISAKEVAERALTIPWELFTGITGRVGRIYR